MIDKKAINYYYSFYEVSKDLTPKQFYDFNMAIFDVMFFSKNIEDITFSDNILNLLWKSVKHSIKSSIKGYCDKKNIAYEDIFAPLANPLANPLDNNIKEKEKEKVQVKGKRVMSSIDFNQEILTIPTNELSEKHFSLSKPSLFRDAPSEYLETLERYINNYVDKLEMEININGGNLSKVLKWDDFYLGAYNYEKKYVNFAMTYQAWARRSK